MPSSAENRVRLQRQFGIAVALFFCFFVLLGGGGAPAPLIHSLHQAAAIVAIAGLAWFHFFVRSLTDQVRWSGLFILLVLLVPALQLIPLPYAVWSSLPGHEAPAQTLELAGAAGGWRPLSLDPEATRFAALTMLPAVAVFLGVAALGMRHRVLLVRLLLAIILLSAMLAALQAALPGTRGLYIYPRSIFTHASGIFANRNFQSDLLLIGILLSAWLVRTQPGQLKLLGRERRGLSFAVLLIPFFALMVIATQSKTGAILLLPVLALAAFTAFGMPTRARLPLYGIATAVAAAAALALLATPFAAGLTERFSTFDLNAEARSRSIPDIFFAIDHYFPLGSGLGTFDYVYRSVESLANVKETYLNHAHNDYLEILLEAGLPGILLVGLFVLAFLIRAWQLWLRRSSSPSSLLQRVSCAALAIILLHSAGDYPLRTVTMLAVFGMLSAFVFTDPFDAHAAARRRRRRSGEEEAPKPTPLPPALTRGPWLSGRRPHRIAGGAALLVVGLAMAGTALTVGMARQFVQAGLGSYAYQLRPDNSRAAALVAGTHLASGDARAALAFARRAVAASPIDAVATRTLGEALSRLRPGAGDDMMVQAARLGWRDRPTQTWVIERALRIGELGITADRVEALARLNTNRELVYSMTRLLALDPTMRQRIVSRLAEQPQWRRGFLADGSPKTPQQLEALATILERLRRTDAPPTLMEARATIDELILSGRPRRAWQLHERLFGSGAAANSLLSDPGFQRRDTDYTPANNNTQFDWRTFALGGGEAGVEGDVEREGNRVLYAISAQGAPAQVLARVAALPPGRYQLRYRVRASAAEGAQGFAWEVRCLEGSTMLGRQEGSRLPRAGGWVERGFAFEVPAGCEAQVIGLVTAEAGREATFDEVRVVRAGG